MKLLEKKKPVLAVNHKSIDQSVNEGSGSQKDDELTTRTEKSIREISRYYLNEKNNNDEKNNNLVRFLLFLKSIYYEGPHIREGVQGGREKLV